MLRLFSYLNWNESLFFKSYGWSLIVKPICWLFSVSSFSWMSYLWWSFCLVRGYNVSVFVPKWLLLFIPYWMSQIHFFLSAIFFHSIQQYFVCLFVCRIYSFCYTSEIKMLPRSKCHLFGFVFEAKHKFLFLTNFIQILWEKKSVASPWKW